MVGGACQQSWTTAAPASDDQPGARGPLSEATLLGLRWRRTPPPAVHPLRDQPGSAGRRSALGIFSNLAGLLLVWIDEASEHRQ